MKLDLFDDYVALIRKNKNFKLLFYSRVISLFGDWFNLIASASLIASLTDSGQAISGLFLARFLPSFFLGPFAGALADRVDRRKILVAADLLRIPVVLAFLLIRSADYVWLIYVLTALQFSMLAFTESAGNSFLPDVVEREDLVVANALLGTAWSVMLMIGAAAGGLVTFWIGKDGAFIIDAFTFVLSAAVMWQVSGYIGVEERPKENSSETTFIKGVQYVWQHKPILMLASLKAIGALGYGALNVLEVTLAEDIYPLFDNGSLSLGIIYLFSGLGTGLGPIFARRWTGENFRLMHTIILLSFIAMFASFLIMWQASNLWILLIGVTIRTIGSGMNWVFSSAMLQMIVPPKYQGRVFAINFALLTLTQSISIYLGGWMTDSLLWTPFHIALVLSVVPAAFILIWIAFQNVLGDKIEATGYALT